MTGLRGFAAARMAAQPKNLNETCVRQSDHQTLTYLHFVLLSYKVTYSNRLAQVIHLDSYVL